MLRKRREFEAKKERDWDALKSAVALLWDTYRQEITDAASYVLDAMEYDLLQHTTTLPLLSSYTRTTVLEGQIEANLARTLEDVNDGLNNRFRQDLNEGRILCLKVREEEELRLRRAACEEEAEHLRCREEARLMRMKDAERTDDVHQQEVLILAAEKQALEQQRHDGREAEYQKALNRFEYEELFDEHKCRAEGRTANALSKARDLAAREAELLKGRRLHEQHDRQREERNAKKDAAHRAEAEQDRAQLFGQLEWEKALEQRLADVELREKALVEEWDKVTALRDSHLNELISCKRSVNDVKATLHTLQKAFMAMHPAVTTLCKKGNIRLENCDEWTNFATLCYNSAEGGN